MTEAEWLVSRHPTPMWWFIEGKASERRLRLIACACCRRIWHLLTEARSRQCIEAAEKLADGLISAEVAKDLLCRFNKSDADRIPLGIGEYSVARSALISHNDIIRAVPSLAASFFEAAGGSREEEGSRQSDIIRDIFGNPFCPARLDPTWLSDNVVALAQTIYEERRFTLMPILADALEDAGCASSEILSHCRTPGEHVLGCWVIDALLGKR